MKLPAGYSLPDFLNLGMAPPAPRGATAVAPRARLVPPFRYGDPFTRIPKAFTAMPLPAYFLPASQLVPGFPFTPNLATRLLPNPYAPQH